MQYFFLLYSSAIDTLELEDFRQSIVAEGIKIIEEEDRAILCQGDSQKAKILIEPFLGEWSIQLIKQKSDK